MERRILGLARALREAGAPVSTAEVVDASRAALAVGVERRDDLGAALRAALVKEASHLPDFAAAFDREFPAGITVPQARRRRGGGARGRGPEGGGPGGGGAPAGGRSETAASPSGAAGNAPAPVSIRESPERSAEAAGAKEGEGGERLGASERRGEEATARADGEAPGAGGEPRRRGLLAAERRRALGKGFRERWGRAEEEAAAAAMEELAERLAERLGRRRARSRRGSLDVRATLRANLRHGGVPFVMVRRRRRPGRPDLVLLADVSGSVRVAAGLFLRVLARLRGRFSGVRAFAYTDRPAEIDARAARGGADGAARAIAGTLPFEALSDHGEVLRRFNRDFGAAVRGSTVVVILGDGRNNRAPAQEWELEAIRRRARRVIWIVPERAALWGSGDSAMPRYAPHCDLVLAAPTPGALIAAAAGILDARSVRRRASRLTSPSRQP